MNEVEAYVAEVRAALADLPPEVRDELLEDLPEHLAEVAAEAGEPRGMGPESRVAGTSLRSRLGPPAQYAAELRATVEIGQPAGRPARLRWATAVESVRGRLRAVDVRLGPLIGYAKASDYLRLLRPGWWLLRGYLAAMAFVYALDFSESMGLLPRVAGNAPAGFVVLAGFMVGSIWLGRRHGRLRPWARYTLGAVSVYLAVVAIAGFAAVDEDVTRPADSYYVGDNTQTDDFEDVFPYDGDGQLLRGVRFFDQDGDPVYIGGGSCDNYVDPQYVYPRCPDQAPFTLPGTSPTPTESPTTTMTETPSPRSTK